MLSLEGRRYQGTMIEETIKDTAEYFQDNVLPHVKLKNILRCKVKKFSGDCVCAHI